MRNYMLYALNGLSFGIGYLYCAFTEVLDAQSFLIPAMLLGTLILACYSTKCFADEDTAND